MKQQPLHKSHQRLPLAIVRRYICSYAVNAKGGPFSLSVQLNCRATSDNRQVEWAFVIATVSAGLVQIKPAT